MIQNLRHFNNERGTTMLEIAIGSTILGIAMATMLSAASYLANAQRKARVLSVMERQVASLISNISKNVHLYQVHPTFFDPEDTRFVDSMLEVLPVAWSDTVLDEVAKCPGCPGRLGFVIQRMNGVPGLVMVSLRVSHPELFGRECKTLSGEEVCTANSRILRFTAAYR